jgi:putative endonuclease
VSSSRAQSRDLFFAESNLLFLFPREKQIKAWRREKKVALIEAANRTWEDLAAEWDARGTNG